MRREIGGRAAPAARAGRAVEQAHDAFDDEKIGAVGRTVAASASSRFPGIAHESRLTLALPVTAA